MQVKLNLFCPARFEADIPQQIGRGFAEYDHEPRPIQVWHDGGEALPMDDVEDLGDSSLFHCKWLEMSLGMICDGLQ